MSTEPVIVWFRQDLRLDDHPALLAAVKSGSPVIPLYIYDEENQEGWKIGGASKWWLHYALKDLSKQIEEAGSKLILGSGKSDQVLAALCRECKAQKVFFNRRYEPASRELEEKISKELKVIGIEFESFAGSLLFEPEAIKTKQGGPYQVYTPYWRACLEKLPIEKSLPAPKNIPSPTKFPKSKDLKDFNLLPKISWDSGFAKFWDPSLEGARKLFKDHRDHKLDDYKEARDFPGTDGTSRLSPYLHFGQISPRRIWHSLYDRPVKNADGKTQYLKEVVWREFAYHLLYHFPHTDSNPLRSEFKKFPWQQDEQKLCAWKKGQTGYPFVDAGMRQLWQVGWMHNRVRMMVASFLVKHLLIAWQEGAHWFWDTLVDADLASNSFGWQWTSGCGADAAPYFRIFNPIMQGEKFDPEGIYIRKYVPELEKMPNEWIHKPWEAPPDVLKKAEVKLGETYPKPIVDHQKARERALKALEKVQKSK